MGKHDQQNSTQKNRNLTTQTPLETRDDHRCSGKKSAKIPKGQSEYVNLRRTDNTMAKEKGEEECEDTKGVIRICKSKKNRQHNGLRKRTRRV